MAYALESKVGDILGEKVDARNVVIKYGVGIMLLQPQTKDMSLQQVAHHMRWTPEKTQALLAELNAL